MGGLGGSTANPDQPPLPSTSKAPVSVLGPECPVLLPDAIDAVRIPQGTSQESISNVLASYGAWIAAGSDILSTWTADVGTVPDKCLDGLAEQGRIAYSQSIFTTHTDVAWQDYFAGQEKLTAQALRNAADKGADGQEDEGRFELLQEIDSSATENGTYLKFDAVYKPAAGAPADPQDWGGLAKPSRWYVELVPFDGQLIINYIE